MRPIPTFYGLRRVILRSAISWTRSLCTLFLGDRSGVCLRCYPCIWIPACGYVLAEANPDRLPIPKLRNHLGQSDNGNPSHHRAGQRKRRFSREVANLHRRAGQRERRGRHSGRQQVPDHQHSFFRLDWTFGNSGRSGNKVRTLPMAKFPPTAWSPKTS